TTQPTETRWVLQVHGRGVGWRTLPDHVGRCLGHACGRAQLRTQVTLRTRLSRCGSREALRMVNSPQRSKGGPVRARVTSLFAALLLAVMLAPGAAAVGATQSPPPPAVGSAVLSQGDSAETTSPADDDETTAEPAES